MKPTASDDLAVAIALKALLENEAPPGLLALYLSGSHGAGRAHRESDVDVGALLDRLAHTTEEARYRERVRLSAWLVSELHRTEIDVVVLNDAPPLLGRHIVTRGIRVFCRDAAADHSFVRDIQLRAADLEPFLRRMRRIKLRALAR